MAQQYEEKEIHVLLDFQGKDTSRFLKQPSVYFRMLNLNEDKPIVEIGEDVYEGTYEDTVGTNIYFEEIENPPPNTSVFEGTTPITLQYLLKQTKVLKMKKIGTKPKPVVDTNPTETVNILINDDYRVLLEKFGNDKLNIEEFVVTEDVVVVDEEGEDAVESDKSDEEQVESNFQWESSRLPPRQSLVPEWYTSAVDNIPNTNAQKESCDDTPKQEQPNATTACAKHIDATYVKYVKLKKLAEQPTRRKIPPETIEDNKFEQPLHSVPRNDFIVWKNLVMQSVEQQPVNLDINKDKVEDFVDIEKSVKAGIINPSNVSCRIFTKEEKRELLSFKNFINVSPLMKLIMLQDFVQLEKTSMSQMTPEQLNKKGEDGCTVQERFNLLKSFKEELRACIILRLQNVPIHDENLAEQLERNLTLKLSDEDLSDTDFSYSSDNDEDDSNDDDAEEHQSDSRHEYERTSSGLSENGQSELQLQEDDIGSLSDVEIVTTVVKQEECESKNKPLTYIAKPQQ